MRGVLVFGVRTARPYPAARAKAVQQALLAQLRAIPGVQSASASQIVPLAGSLWDRRVRVEGYTFRLDEPEEVGFNAIAPDYFATLKTPLMSGREFDDRDTEASPKVAVVNESFVRRFFGTQTALGRHVTSVNVTYEIVGVVKDAKYQDLRTAVISTMYVPGCARWRPAYKLQLPPQSEEWRRARSRARARSRRSDGGSRFAYQKAICVRHPDR